MGVPPPPWHPHTPTKSTNPLTTALAQPLATAGMQRWSGVGREINSARDDWLMGVISPAQDTQRLEELDDQKGAPDLEGLEHLLSPRNPSERISGEAFAMAWAPGVLRVVGLVSQRRLNASDLHAFLALVGLMQHPTGRVEITAAALAERLERDPGNVRNSLARLRRLDLIARWQHPRTGRQYYLLNPAVASMGGASARGYTFRCFNEDRIRPAGGKAAATPAEADGGRLTARVSIEALEIAKGAQLPQAA